MKIKLSKSQWEEVGKKSGWMKKAQLVTPVGTGGPFGTPVQAPAQAAPAKAQAPAQAAPAQAAPAKAQAPVQNATPTLEWLNTSLDKVLNSGAILKEIDALVKSGGSAQTMVSALNGQLQMLMSQLTKAGEGRA